MILKSTLLAIMCFVTVASFAQLPDTLNTPPPFKAAQVELIDSNTLMQLLNYDKEAHHYGIRFTSFGKDVHVVPVVLKEDYRPTFEYHIVATINNKLYQWKAYSPNMPWSYPSYETPQFEGKTYLSIQYENSDHGGTFDFYETHLQIWDIENMTCIFDNIVNSHGWSAYSSQIPEDKQPQKLTYHLGPELTIAVRPDIPITNPEANNQPVSIEDILQRQHAGSTYYRWAGGFWVKVVE